MDTHETQIYAAFLTVILLMGVIIIYFVVSLARHQKRNLELDRRNILTEATTLENEQSRLARDLHDELGPLITAAKFNISSIEAVENDLPLLQSATTQLDEAMNKIREIARDLMPASLSKKGLKTALEDFIASLPPTLTIRLQYQADLVIAEEKSVHIYRIIKEITQNTLKHADATVLLILVKEEQGKIYILCEDNGKGFDYTKTLAQNRGIGLRNMKSRTELMEGQFNPYSVPGKGTQYKILIPIKTRKPI